MSKQIDDGGPAFPVIIQESRGPTGEQYQQMHVQDGMSLRDWFAGQALAMLGQCWVEAGSKEGARFAYEYADAMLAARKAGQP